MPVFFVMPIVVEHDGYGISTQMLNTLELYIKDIRKHLQSVSNDGQYIHLDIKKHFFALEKVYKI